MGLKSSLKKAVSHLIQYDLIWKVLNATVLQLSRYIEWEHHLQVERSKEIPLEVDAIEQFCPDFTVKHGPFQGLKYPNTSIVRGTFQNSPYAEINPICGNLFPKLIGSYERELHPVLNTILDRGYSKIINVGCAEGFYTVGLALKFPEAEISAYDLKQSAREHCLLLAQLNQCEQQIHLADFCSPETLLSIPLQSRALIVCDCEGYEVELFTEEVVPHLKQCDILIELHDYVDMNISTTIKKRFEETHEYKIIQSTDDLEKARTYPINELTDYNLNDRRQLLRENRAYLMDWIFLTPIDQLSD